MLKRILVVMGVLLITLAAIYTCGFGASKQKTVYLTFDDGPSINNTEQILDILKENHIHATFFINGPKKDNGVDQAAWERIITRIHAEGHTIGNHTYDHNYELVYKSADAFKATVQKLDDAVFAVTGEHTRVFRFPGGSNTGYINRESGVKGFAYSELMPWLNANGYKAFDWNVTSADAAGVDVPKLVLYTYVRKGILDSKKDRFIVLHHDSFPKTTTVQSLKSEIAWMEANQYRFDTVDHLPQSYIFGRGWTDLGKTNTSK